ncbi:hypothetical protein JKP88DRAFT_294327 [Tribonema minus]|uniref:Peptidase C19 ubiquitin carboxyl-terminal hydrolase domain-containing protein n=1 Tax=Tribonema minus TaxID=303371 RepID=A0A836CQK2_9STRA|nr:hypothetical protein JKP88DRAFT_294327 [Tribonema minus]
MRFNARRACDDPRTAMFNKVKPSLRRPRDESDDSEDGGSSRDCAPMEGPTPMDVDGEEGASGPQASLHQVTAHRPSGVGSLCKLGLTCHANCALQLVTTIRPLRDAVLRMKPTSFRGDQRLRCKVQEMLHGSSEPAMAHQLFEGTVRTLTTCVGKPHLDSPKDDTIEALQLAMQGRDTLQESEWTSSSARPYWLSMLKRFEYDEDCQESLKINDRLEFPQVLDVNPYTGAHSVQDASPPNMYALQGVGVHSGSGPNVGHYYTFVRFGTEDVRHPFNGCAYILLYVRQRDEADFAPLLAARERPEAPRHGGTAAPTAAVSPAQPPQRQKTPRHQWTPEQDKVLVARGNAPYSQQWLKQQQLLKGLNVGQCRDRRKYHHKTGDIPPPEAVAAGTIRSCSSAGVALAHGHPVYSKRSSPLTWTPEEHKVLAARGNARYDQQWLRQQELLDGLNVRQCRDRRNHWHVRIRICATLHALHSQWTRAEEEALLAARHANLAFEAIPLATGSLLSARSAGACRHHYNILIAPERRKFQDQVQKQLRENPPSRTQHTIEISGPRLTDMFWTRAELSAPPSMASLVDRAELWETCIPGQTLEATQDNAMWTTNPPSLMRPGSWPMRLSQAGTGHMTSSGRWRLRHSLPPGQEVCAKLCKEGTAAMQNSHASVDLVYFEVSVDGQIKADGGPQASEVPHALVQQHTRKTPDGVPYIREVGGRRGEAGVPSVRVLTTQQALDRRQPDAARKVLCKGVLNVNDIVALACRDFPPGTPVGFVYFVQSAKHRGLLSVHPPHQFAMVTNLRAHDAFTHRSTPLYSHDSWRNGLVVGADDQGRPIAIETVSALDIREVNGWIWVVVPTPTGTTRIRVCIIILIPALLVGETHQGNRTGLRYAPFTCLSIGRGLLLSGPADNCHGHAAEWQVERLLVKLREIRQAVKDDLIDAEHGAKLESRNAGDCQAIARRFPVKGRRRTLRNLADKQLLSVVPGLDALLRSPGSAADTTRGAEPEPANQQADPDCGPDSDQNDEDLELTGSDPDEWDAESLPAEGQPMQPWETEVLLATLQTQELGGGGVEGADLQALFGEALQGVTVQDLEGGGPGGGFL